MDNESITTTSSLPFPSFQDIDREEDDKTPGASNTTVSGKDTAAPADIAIRLVSDGRRSRGVGGLVQSTSKLTATDGTSLVKDPGKGEEIRSRLDEGWGWVVALAGLVTHILTFGLAYSTGVFTITWLEVFGQNEAQTSAVTALVIGVMLCTGPFTGFLVNKFGPRPIAITGGILATLGLFLGSFSQNIYHLYLTYDIFTGLGFGLSYLPAMVMIGRHFERRHSLASGIASSGSGWGTLIFASLCQYLVDQIGWRNAFRVLAGNTLLLCVCGALYRPEKIPLSSRETEDETVADQLALTSIAASCRTSCRTSASTTHALPTPAYTTAFGGTTTLRPQDPFSDKKIEARFLRQLNSLSRHPPEKFLDELKSESLQGPSDTPPEKPATWGATSPSPYSGVVKAASQATQTHPKPKLCAILGAELKIIGTLFKNNFFRLFLLSNFCMCFGYGLPYIYFQAYALTLGIDKNSSAFILSGIGIADTVGRLFMGLIFNGIPALNTTHGRVYGYSISTFVTALLLLLAPIARNYAGLFTISCLYGLVAGSTDLLVPVMLKDFLGIQRLGYSLGVVIILQGCGFFIGAPFAGILYGLVEDYSVIYYVGGVAFFLSSVFVLVEPLITRWKTRQTSKNVPIIASACPSFQSSQQQQINIVLNPTS